MPDLMSDRRLQERERKSFGEGRPSFGEGRKSFGESPGGGNRDNGTSVFVKNFNKYQGEEDIRQQLTEVQNRKT